MACNSPAWKRFRYLSRDIHPAVGHVSSAALHILLSLLFPATLIDAANQPTASFVDPLTNITFQRFFGAKTRFSFGIALPENPSTDFIGQISAPMSKGKGWVGISFQGQHGGPLLLCAWSNGNKVVSSFRVAKYEDDSPPVVTGVFKIMQMNQGTVVNNTHMTFTFLCQNCVGDAQNSFTTQDTAGKFGMGWALADAAVSDPANPTAVLGFHNVGFDEFIVFLSEARSPLFGKWARIAGANGIASNGSTILIAVDRPGSNVGEVDVSDSDDETDSDDDADADADDND